MAEQLNVLWIMTDQHQADCLGCMGHPAIQTPNLDRLAAEGVLFTNAFCQSPVCMASRAALFTGRTPAAVQVRGMGILPPWETTFPEMLLRHGYHTGAFGKVHLTPEQYVSGQLGSSVPILDWRRFAPAALPHMVLDGQKENYGFATHLGCDDACQGNHHAWLRARGEAVRPRPGRVAPDWPGDTWVSPYPSELHQTTFIAEHAARYIRQRQGHGPWLAFCSFVAPHHPFEAPADQLARYDRDRLPAPQAKGGVDPRGLPEVVRQAIGEVDRWPAAAIAAIVHHYLASIGLIDDAVGTLLETLAATGQAGNTIVVFVADHGEFLGNHGLLRKPSLHYDETLRVPLIMRVPGAAAGGRVDGLTELIDLHPTLLGLLGIPVNPGVQGTDWSAALRDNCVAAIGHEAIYSDMYDLAPMTHGTPGGPYTAVMTLRTVDWKLNIYPTADAAAGQLFCLRDDPDEAVNLYHDPGHRTQREELLHALLCRAHRNVDPLPLRLTQW